MGAGAMAGAAEASEAALLWLGEWQIAVCRHGAFVRGPRCKSHVPLGFPSSLPTPLAPTC